MSQYITLLGSESVEKDAYVIRDAGNEMVRAADMFAEAMRQFTNLVDRMEQIERDVAELMRTK